MSLDRTALRLAIVMALTNAYTEPFPTLAASCVYDSRMDPVSGVSDGELLPHVVVYTDTDDGKGLSTNNGGPPFGRDVTLVFDLTIGMVSVRKDGNVVVRIETELALEAMLDLLEQQILDVFKYPQRSAWALRLFEKHIVRVDSWQSLRFVEREGQTRLAGRQISVRAFMPQEDDAVISGTEPQAALPEPLNGLIEAIIAADGPARGDAEYLRDTLLASIRPAGLVLEPLERIRLKESDQGGGNLSADGPARPDGVAQVTLPT